MQVFDIKTFEELDKVLEKAEASIDYKRIDQAIKQKALNDIHDNILHRILQDALTELHPPRPKAKRAPKPKVKKVAEVQ